MRRSLALPLLLALLAPSAARAEVTRETPIIEDSGHTLRKGELKLGIGTSSYGLTDRLQVDSALILDLAVLNAGLKYKLIDAPNLVLSVNGFGGGSLIGVVLGFGLFYAGVRADASIPLHEKLSLNFSGGLTYWQASRLNAEATSGLPPGSLSWYSLKAVLQYVHAPRHIFFVTWGTPTNWVFSSGGTHEFDALDFAAGTVGYQYSRGAANIRFDIGWGPSLFGRGPILGLDFYVRF